jgi:biopolymer transport protein ExbB
MKTQILTRTFLQVFLVIGAHLCAVSTLSAQTDVSALSAEGSQSPAEGSQLPAEGSVDDSSADYSADAAVPSEGLPPLPEMSVPGALTDDASNAATAAEASTAEAHSGYGLSELWAQGDLVARGTLIIMVIMSAATWYVLVTKLIQQQILLTQAKSTRKFWKSKNLAEGMTTYKEHSAFRSVAADGVTALEQHQKRQGEKLDLSDWLGTQLQRSVDRVVAQLQNGLSLLATVGSCSPFVGLFGTVWGIYNALIAIGLSGQASIDKVAGPVGEALIMTAIGLAVAVPAVLGYNWLVRRNKVIVDDLRNFAADIHANLTMGVKGG